MNKKYFPLLTIPLILIPFIIWLTKNGSCGWDCGFYIYHLGKSNILTLHKEIEPLYFYLFKPLVMLGISPELTVKISIILLETLMLVGLWKLGQRLKLNWIATTALITIVAFDIAVLRMSSDTLRNFLAFSLFPWFIYFYMGKSKGNRVASYLTIILMALSHRMVMMVLPIMWAYRISRKEYKSVIKETLYVVLPVFLIFFFIRDSTTSNTLIQVSFQLIDWNSIVDNLINNARMIYTFHSIPFFYSVLCLILMKKPDERFSMIMLLMFSSITIVFTHLLANRPMTMIAIPIGMIIATVLHHIIGEFKKKRYKQFITLFILFIMVISGQIATGVIYRIDSGTTIAYEEMEFIKDIEIPNNSTLVAPSRLYWYTRYVWDHKHNIPDLTYWDYLDPYNAVVTPDSALIYYGVNNFGTDVYYIDGDHWFSGNGTLTLNVSTYA